MNTPAKQEHPEWMTADDIAIYDQMICMGRLQIGKEIGANEDYLLHIASMITLKQMKGMTPSMDKEGIAELKRIHQEHLEAGLIFETPASDWYESALALQRPYLDPVVEQQINEINGITSNLVIDDKNDIKEDWVKLVEPVGRPAPAPEAEPEAV